MEDFRNKDSLFVLLNSVKKSFLPHFPLPVQKSEYNVVVDGEIQRWTAVKHSLWVPCKVILYYTLDSNAAHMVGNC